MMRTEESEELGRVNAWAAPCKDPTNPDAPCYWHEQARELADKVYGDSPSLANCELVERALYLAYEKGKQRGRPFGSSFGPSDQEIELAAAAKSALQKAERCLDPQHARTCAAVELMLKKGGVSENDRNVIARTCNCHVSPEDALTVVRVALRGFT